MLSKLINIHQCIRGIIGIVAFLMPLSIFAVKMKEFDPIGSQPYTLDEKFNKIPIYKESHALLISVSAYKGVKNKGWKSLPNTSEEVDHIQAVLQQHGFHIVRIYDPTGSELVEAYRSFIAKYGHRENSRLLFLFAGHGYTDERKFGYLVPIDANDPHIDPEGFLAKAKPIRDLITIAEEISVKHALFIFDSCFSGSIFATRGPYKIPDPRSTAQERKNFFTGAAQKTLRYFITAGNEDEEVPDSSLFGKLLIDGLNGKASRSKDGYITSKELGLWLEQTVPHYAESKQSPHSGLIRGSDYISGDMVFQISDDKSPTKPVSDLDSIVSIPIESEDKVIQDFWSSLDPKISADPKIFDKTKKGEFSPPERIELPPLQSSTSADTMNFPGSSGVKGQVRWFNDAKGFGFITQDGVVHHSSTSVEANQLTSPAENSLNKIELLPYKPSVMVLAGNGKSFDQFRVDNNECIKQVSDSHLPNQQQLDNSYMQCMAKKGHRVPTAGRFLP